MTNKIFRKPFFPQIYKTERSHDDLYQNFTN